jgi:MraZ protein
MIAFRGNYPTRIEEGGRLKIPTQIKKLLDDAGVTEVYITSEDGVSAQIWPLQEWEKQEKRLAVSGTMDEAVDDYMEVTSYYGQQMELDKQGRVTLPQILRKDAGLEGEVAVQGKLNYVKVQLLEQVKDKVKSTLMTPERRKVLAPILKPEQES